MVALLPFVPDSVMPNTVARVQLKLAPDVALNAS
jgi:hypothetical protein